MTKTAHKVLDGDTESLPHPTLAEQLDFWRPVLEANSDFLRPINAEKLVDGLESVRSPITEGEEINN